MTPQIAFTLALLVASIANAAAPKMKEGLWEMAVKMETAGDPGNVSTETAQRCMTAKDFQDPRKTAPDSRTGQCEISNYRLQASTATWDIACKGSEPMRGSGTIKYEPDRYTGVNNMTISQGGQPAKMTMNYAGRYLGPCKPGQKQR